MKKLSILIVFIYLALSNLHSQDIILTFNAKDASNTIDSIRATKVETGETAFVEGSNTINMSSFTTGTKLFPTNSEGISVYPNPFDNVTHLNFSSNQNDNIIVSLINATGQVVAEKNQNITFGVHQFNISTNKNGMYILNVTGNQTKFSQKIISINKNRSVNKIEYNEKSSMSQKEKSAEIEKGELVFFYVYSGGNITKIADSPTESKTYEVEFFQCKDADEKSYPIVQIGPQWWMAENLAYLPFVNPVSQGTETDSYYYIDDYNGSNVVEAKSSNYYKTYGVLYNWLAALNGESGSSSNPSGVKGICPNGWHLPSSAEWNQLAKYVSNTLGPYMYSDDDEAWYGVDKHLKSNYGWTMSKNGTDDFGFTALAGGYRMTWSKESAGFITYVNEGGYWYTSTFSNTSNLIYWGIEYDESSLWLGYTDKKYQDALNVRCVKDENIIIRTKEISNTTSNSAKSGGIISDDVEYEIIQRGVCWNTTEYPTTLNNKTTDGSGTGSFTSSITGLTASTTYYVRAYAINSQGTIYGNQVEFTTASGTNTGTFSDSRDGNEYNWVKIGNQIWMAENLAYLPSVSPSSVGAMNVPYYYIYDYNGTDVSAAKATVNYGIYGVLYNWPAALTACPNGWHLPSDAEWTELTNYLGGESVTGGKLKETGTTHWGSPNTGATNETSFSALPGGRRYFVGNFSRIVSDGYWWSSTMLNTDLAWGRHLNSYSSSISLHSGTKDDGFSVRCVRD